MENPTLGCRPLKVGKSVICRLCMKTHEYYLNIFVSYEEFTMSIGKAIEDLLVLKVSKDDNLPEMVCCPCVTKLMEFREFKDMCMNSAREFGRHAPVEPITCPVEEEFRPVQLLGESTSRTWSNCVDGECRVPVAPNDLSVDSFAVENQTYTEKVYPRDPLAESDDCGEEDFAEADCNEDATVYCESTLLLMDDQVDRSNYTGGVTEELENESDKFGADGQGILKNKALCNPSCNSVREENLQFEYSMTNSFVVDCFPEKRVKKQKKNVKFCASSKKFSQSNDRARHVRNHEHKQLCHQAENSSYPAKYMCNYCRRSYSGKKSLALHIKRHVDGKKSASVLPKEECSPRFSQNLLVEDRGNVESVIVETSNISFMQKSYRCKNEKPDIEKSSGGENLGRELNSSGTLLFTIAKPRENAEFVCDTCGRIFMKKTDLVKHLNVHTGLNPCYCRFCGEKLIPKDMLNENQAMHTADERFKCNMCGKKCSKIHVQQKRAVTHKNLKPLTCDLCGKNFKNTKTLNLHSVIHTGVKAFKCNVCGKMFYKISNLKKHSVVHTGVKAFKCNECGKLFSTKSGLSMHSVVHTGVKAFKCDECGKMFTQSGSLKMHSVIHTGVKRFKCNECGKVFTQKSSLNLHSVVHTGVKRYQCNECGKMFAHSSSLNTHSVVHTGVMQFKCDVCGKQYKWRANFDRHLRKHADQNPGK